MRVHYTQASARLFFFVCCNFYFGVKKRNKWFATRVWLLQSLSFKKEKKKFLSRVFIAEFLTHKKKKYLFQKKKKKKYVKSFVQNFSACKYYIWRKHAKALLFDIVWCGCVYYYVFLFVFFFIWTHKKIIIIIHFNYFTE